MDDLWKWVKGLAEALGPAAEALRLADHVAWATVATMVIFALFAPPAALDLDLWEWITHAISGALWWGPRLGAFIYVVGLVRRIAEHEDFI